MAKTKKDLLFLAIRNSVIKTFVHSPLNTSELTTLDIGELIDNKKITLKEIMSAYKDEILYHFPRISP